MDLLTYSHNRLINIPQYGDSVDGWVIIYMRVKAMQNIFIKMTKMMMMMRRRRRMVAIIALKVNIRTRYALINIPKCPPCPCLLLSPFHHYCCHHQNHVSSIPLHKWQHCLIQKKHMSKIQFPMFNLYLPSHPSLIPETFQDS